MKEQFTPGEHAEAQDKLNQHEKGREEAKFYRQLLENFYGKVIKQISQTDLNQEIDEVDLNTTDLKLKQLRCDADILRIYMKESSDLVAQALGMRSYNLNFEVDSFADMTPRQFHNYIEKQKDSLIKK